MSANTRLATSTMSTSAPVTAGMGVPATGSHGDGTEVAWRDPKRYAWLLGAIVPLMPFMAYGLVKLDRRRGVLADRAGDHLRAVPDPRHRHRPRRREPARQRPEVARAGPLLPLVHVRVPPAAVRVARVRLLAVEPRRPRRARQARPHHHRRPWSAGSPSTRRTSSATSATASSAGCRGSPWPRPATATSTSSTTAATTCAWPRPRTRPARAWARASTPSGRGRSTGSLRSSWELEKVRLARLERVAVVVAQRPARRLGDDGRAVRRADRRLRRDGPALPAAPGGPRLLAARGGQLPRALRAAAPAPRGRPLRALPPRAQLELQQRRLQRPALPPAAPLRPPRQPDPPLSGAALTSTRRPSSRPATPA